MLTRIAGLTGPGLRRSGEAAPRGAARGRGRGRRGPFRRAGRSKARELLLGVLAAARLADRLRGRRPERQQLEPRAALSTDPFGDRHQENPPTARARSRTARSREWQTTSQTRKTPESAIDQNVEAPSRRAWRMPAARRTERWRERFACEQSRTARRSVPRRSPPRSAWRIFRRIGSASAFRNEAISSTSASGGGSAFTRPPRPPT